MALGLIQHVTEMSTGIFPGVKGGQCVGLTTLLPSCADCLKIWEPQPPGTLTLSAGPPFQNFSTPCILNVDNTGAKQGSIMK
jgi:hypothetical protein